MDEQELLKERFKSAISSTVKAISENFDLEIKFGNNITSKKNSLNLPEVANLKKLQDFHTYCLKDILILDIPIIQIFF